ncbi:spore germination protein [Ammoniphilus resinae]|uniref:Spore germination protein KA n=1 Tax=Ammoniphilus resinae TaxID=861532 RepID=A0ABS4GJY9_9BACL|nr:spore germination protein [Ammoniphilus resinae]MBP1930561.1 spore germination protein KA [Ammoniphilus resinae]
MFFWRRKNKRENTGNIDVPQQFLEKHKNEKINKNLEDTLVILQQLLGANDDIVVRRFRVFKEFSAAMVYCSSLVDHTQINMDVLKPLMSTSYRDETWNSNRLQEIILEETLYHSDLRLESDLSKIVRSILSGGTLVFIDGMNDGFVVGTRKVDKRAINQPGTEQVIRGPREGFIEQLGTNISLLRYRLPTADLRVKTMEVGRVTKSKVAICYLEGIASPDLVEEVKDRISAIDIDVVLDVGYLEQFIEDNHMSPFPQIQNTERPDKTVAQLAEGRVAILSDGSPFALIVPTVFHQFYQTPEDYAQRFLMASAIRLIRLVSLFFSLIASSLYVAIISFNPELIPTQFAVAVAGGRAGVPFPAVVEVFVMEVSMEILREATVRLPQQVGGALSIVGVLVIGQAAVSAGFVSPITVVVIALTTIGSFATPAYNAAMALRLLRFPIIFLAGVFGLYGVMVGIILIINHMLSLRSFGVPYMSPVVPGNYQGMKDIVMRAPLWWMKKRPASLHTANRERIGDAVIEKLKQPPSNTLNPINVGNRKEDPPDGDTT